MGSITKLMVAALLSANITAEPAPADAAPPVDEAVPADALAHDFARVKAALIEGAAGLYRYRTKAEVDRTFRAVEAKLTRPMTPLEFWRVVTPALASFGDGHMVVMLDREQMRRHVDGREFPLAFRIVANRFYVTENGSDAAIPEGSEIVSIDGMSAVQLIARCGAFIPADGGLPIRKLRKVEREFTATCVPALNLGPSYDLVVRPPGGRARHMRVQSRQTPPSETATPTASPEAVAPSFYQLDLRPGGTAVLKLGSFVRSATVNPAEGFATAFAEIEREAATDLILDMRGSAGGRDSDGALLFSYLAKSDFRYVERRIANQDHFTRQDNSDALNGMVAQIPHERRADGRIVLRDTLDAIQHPQAKHAYRGRVYLIVDGNTFSTGSEFASVFKYYRRGPVIGEETGTAAAGGSGGPATLRLTRSGVSVDVPLVEYVMPGAKTARRARGVQPDHAVARSVPDLMSGNDRAMNEAIALVALNNKSPRPK